MRCGLLGRTLSHSHSPLLHSLLGSYDYALFEIPPEQVEDFLRSGPWDGLNVTIPYKRTAYALCDSLSPAAREAGNVNTLLRRPDGSLYGDNTDAFGFSYLLEKSGISVAGREVLVLGTGGAAQTVCSVLHRLGAHIAAGYHTVPPCTEILRRTVTDFFPISAPNRHRNAPIVINATPVGMYPHNGRSPVNLADFPHCEAVFDLIYNPLRTALLLQAETLEIQGFNGLPMLCAQAAAAASVFTGAPVSYEKIRRAEAVLRRKIENIILIGMPGSGKTTLARLLAKDLGRECLDCDEELLRRTGLTAEEFLIKQGEAAFREMETEILRDLGKRWGTVLSTGGGCVTRPENRALLRQNGRVLWLQRDLDKLALPGRPLLRNTTPRALYEARKDLYADFCDEAASNNADPARGLAQIKEILEKS